MDMLGAMTGVTAMPWPPTIQSLRSLVVADGLCPLPPTPAVHYVKEIYHDHLYLDSNQLTDVIVGRWHRQ